VECGDVMEKQPIVSYDDEFVPFAPDKKRDGETIRWQLSSDDVIERLKLTLLNRTVEYDPETGKTKLKKKGKPLMNEEGVEEVASVFLEPMFQRGIILSNFTDKEINKMMIIMRNKLILLLRRKWRKFGINKANLSSIVEVIDNVIFSTFKRAAYEGERRYLTTTQRITESRNIQESPEKKAGFSLFGRRE